MNLKNRLQILMLALLILAVAAVSHAGEPKYVFFFLGDGMSSTQIQATEAFLTTKNGGDATVATDLLKAENRLNMSKMPVIGMQTTFDARSLMTDSASSATAFSSGFKTLSGVIGMDETRTTSYKSIAQLAHESGKKVGIITSVSLDHATPAAYYASTPSRNYYNYIATQLANSGYEFFGGGGFARPTGGSSGDTNNNIWNLLAANGYEVRNEKASIVDLKSNPRDKVVCINPVLPTSSAMPYAIDKPAENLSLAEMVDVAVATLSSKDKGKGFGRHRRDDGFFLMVEGGKIDWACHANDAIATIGDMIDFDHAVAVALEFYKRHPHETLIIVTGDHETGGMTIGHATTGYKAYYGKLLNQTISYEAFQIGDFAVYKAAHPKSGCAGVSSQMMALMESRFGLRFSELNSLQKAKLDNAYNQSLCGFPYTSSEKNLLYSGYEPLIVTLTQVLNENASIGWTSYMHTGVPVPVFAQGRGAEQFQGFYDNTDIAKKMARIMRLPSLPVIK